MQLSPDWIVTSVPPGAREVGLNSTFGPCSDPDEGIQFLLSDQDSLLGSLGNSLKKRSDLTGFQLIQSPGSVSETRDSLYFSLIAGKFPSGRGVRSKTGSSATESSPCGFSDRIGSQVASEAGVRPEAFLKRLAATPLCAAGAVQGSSSRAPSPAEE
jgi:hypothetical protein